MKFKDTLCKSFLKQKSEKGIGRVKLRVGFLKTWILEPERLGCFNCDFSHHYMTLNT